MDTLIQIMKMKTVTEQINQFFFLSKNKLCFYLDYDKDLYERIKLIYPNSVKYSLEVPSKYYSQINRSLKNTNVINNKKYSHAIIIKDGLKNLKYTIKKVERYRLYTILYIND